MRSENFAKNGPKRYLIAENWTLLYRSGVAESESATKFKPEVELRRNSACAVKISPKVVQKRNGIPVMP